MRMVLPRWAFGVDGATGAWFLLFVSAGGNVCFGRGTRFVRGLRMEYENCVSTAMVVPRSLNSTFLGRFGLFVRTVL